MLQATAEKVYESDVFRKLKGFWNKLMVSYGILKKILKGEINKYNFEGIIKDVMSLTNIKGRVDVSDKRISDGYYNKIDNIWNSVINEPGGIDKVYVDKMKMVQHQINFEKIPGYVTLHTVIDVLEYFYDDIREDVDHYYNINSEIERENVYDKDMETIEDENPRLYDLLCVKSKDLVEDSQGFYDMVDSRIFEIYGIDYPEDHFNEFESLGYWTVYFEPRYMDEDLAWQCGLMPFTYHERGIYDKELLALGGCGMDLSPKLDAYQAMQSGSVSKDSKFIRDPEYAKTVVGNKMFKKVMDSISKNPEIKIQTH